MRFVVSCTILIMSVALNASAYTQENLLVNSDLRQGEPGENNFGWVMDLAKDQKSECTVVNGRRPGSRAIRIYNDELGESYIIQEIAVRPWRWYVAEVWVNSEGMRNLGFAPYLMLQGGRGVSGRHNFDDAWELPKAGWHQLRLIEHTTDSDRLTLKLGGQGWSGEMLFTEPVVRESSMLEATRALWQTHHPAPTPYEHHLIPWEPKGDQGPRGYAFHKRNFARVARNYPNSFEIWGRFNPSPDPEGRISLWLPPGKCEMVIDSDLEAGELAVGYVQYEWHGGSQLPMPIYFQGVEPPQVTPPKRAVTMITVAPETFNNWEGGRGAMVRDLKRFGFTRMEVWGRSDVRPYYAEGISSANQWSPNWDFDAEKYPDARGVSLNGKHAKLMCPSYRGPAFTLQLANAKESSRYASALSLDDEWYAMRGSQSPTICFGDRCMERWNGWVSEHKPELEKVSPKIFARQPHKYPGHYDAWLLFRGYLVAEKYALIRQAFFEALKETQVKTTPYPWVQAYIGGGPVIGLHSNKSLAEALDYVANMDYSSARVLRENVARLAPQTGKKLLFTISPGYLGSPPGDARSQVLEVVMGGSQGVHVWCYHIGTDTGHMVDMAEAIKMFSPVEDIILDGAVQAGYTSDTNSVNLLARVKDDESVLLVSDYSPNPGRMKVSVPGEAELEVTDLFTDQVVARLDAKERSFATTLKRTFTARLYHLQSTK